MRDSTILAPDGARNRYLAPQEVPDVPWVLPGLFTGADFNVADYVSFDIEPCCTHADENGELSVCRLFEAPGRPVTMWSVYLRDVEGLARCVADFSSAPAARTFAACLMAQFGIYDETLWPMLNAAGGMFYGVQAEKDESDDGEETSFGACDEAEAEIFAIYAHGPGLGAGGCDLVHDAPSRSAAIEWINVQRAPDIGEGNNTPASDRKER